MRKAGILLIVFLLHVSCSSDELLRFRVNAGELSYLDCRVSIDLSQYKMGDYKTLTLFEESENGTRKLPFQIEESDTEQLLWFKLEGEFPAGESRIFLFRHDERTVHGEDHSIKIQQSSKDISIIEDETPVLLYRTAEKMPPEGVDSLYRLSGYIHPLWSPGGEVLTRIQPPDHYHQYGIWSPWTKTHIKGREIDYWNLGKGQGRVRYAKLHFIEEGALLCKFGVRLEHIDYGSLVPERVTMEEDMICRYWGHDRKGSRYILDKSMCFTNILNDTILFDAYRYGGGITIRTTGRWKADNCTVLTSEGKTRIDADGTKARWCIVEGESSVEEGRSGILFLSHPDNREHPEPMRVWPPDSKNGELMFEFCPIRHLEWVIVPGVENKLQYRMVVFDGIMTVEEAEMYWNGFAQQPEVVFY